MMDVAVIQRFLNLQKIPGALIPLKVDGRAGNKTISRIKAFQKEVLKLDPPDGLVEPGGITFLTLLQNAQLKTVKSFSFSDDGLKLLEFMEGGARLKPYDDQTGKTITQWVKGATIGCGHLISKKKMAEI